MRGHGELTAASIAALLCAAVAVVAPVEEIRVAAALPLALFLPGYAVTAAVFAPLSPTGMHSLLLSLAMSLATLVICSLLLTLLPGGLQAGSWATILVVVVLAGCFVAAYRRPQRGGGGLSLPAIRVRFVDAALLAGAAAAVGAAVAVAFTPFPAKDVVGYTRLWMLPLGEGGRGGVRIGVASEEQETTVYRLAVEVNGERPPDIDHLTLEPGQARVIKYRVETSPGESLRIVATLYRADRPTIQYRRVRGWVLDPNDSSRAGPRGLAGD